MDIQTLREEIKKAMILKRDTGNESRYMTLKSILEKAQKEAKEKRQEDTITDSMIVSAAKKEIKQLEDTKSFCEEGTVQFTVLSEKIAVASELLPKMATAEEVRDYLEAHRESITNIGEGMKLLSEKFTDTLDKKVASQLVREVLY